MKKTSLMLAVVLIVALVGTVGFAEEQERGEDYGNYNCPGAYWGPGGQHHGMNRGWHRRGYDWKSMTPEQRKKLETMWGGYLKDTLVLRQQLTAKQLELEMLWHQPDLNEERIGKLSGEVAELETQLLKKRNAYLIECRKDFGGQGWACPGGRW